MIDAPKVSDFASLNGRNIHYEIYGNGDPLFFLHGYTHSSSSWLPFITDFADDYEVYLVDLPGHGKSDAFTKDLSIKEVADELNGLMQFLNLEKIRAIGFSFGGDVLYQLALINPSLLLSMVTIGAVGSWTIKDFPEYQKIFTFENRAQFPHLKTEHGSDEKIKAMLAQFLNYSVHLDIEQLKVIKPEVLIMLGDDDPGMDINEVARVRTYLPNSDLWILPNVAHSAHLGLSKKEFVKKAKTFLSKQQTY